MASISEMLIGSALESSKTTADVTGAVDRGMKHGAALAEQAERIKMQRVAIEKQKEDIRDRKIKEVSEDLLKAKTLSGKALSGYKKFLTNKITTYEVADVFDPETVEMVTSTPENLDRFGVVVDDVQNGRKTYAEAVELLKDQSKFYDVTPDMLKDVRKASEIATQDRTAMDRAKVAAAAALGKQIQAQEAAPDVALRTTLAKEVATYDSSNIDANVKGIKEVIADLKSGNIKTGKLTSFVPTDTAQKLLNAKNVAALNKAKKAIQASLKQTLGSQFTKEEGERVENRTADGQLDNAANIASLEAELEKIEQTKRTKESQFRQYGFKPANGAKKKSFNDLSPADQAAVIRATMQRTKKSEAEVRKMLGAK